MKKKVPKYKRYQLRDYCFICNIKLKPSRENMCIYCGGTFCDDHHNVHNHNCQGDHKGKLHSGGIRPTKDSVKFV